MTKRRFRFTIRQLFVITFAIAGAAALLVSFGPHFLWASRHLVVQQHLALIKVDSKAVPPDLSLSVCRFNGLSFDVPASMLGTRRIIRSSPTDVWLTLEDENRFLQIPLSPTDIRNGMATVPSELQDLTSPLLLEIAASAASVDFSILMSKTELRIHDWSLRTRALMNLEAEKMDRYSRMSDDDKDLIIISADPASLDSKRRLRSILEWESKDRQRFGSIWFGDSQNVEVSWIEAVARSLVFTAEERLTTTELLSLRDDEILSRLKVLDSQKN